MTSECNNRRRGGDSSFGSRCRLQAVPMSGRKRVRGIEHMKTKTMKPKWHPPSSQQAIVLARVQRQQHQRLARPDVYGARFCNIQPSLATCQHLVSASTCSASHRVHGVCRRVAKSRQVRWRQQQQQQHDDQQQQLMQQQQQQQNNQKHQHQHQQQQQQQQVQRATASWAVG